MKDATQIMARRNSSNQIDRAVKLDAEIKQQHTLDNIGATSEEIAQYTTVEKIIAARSAEKARLVRHPLVEPEVQSTSVKQSLAELLAAASTTTAPRFYERAAEVRAIGQPLVDETHALRTAFGLLRSKHQANVQKLRGTDWVTLRKRVPPGHELVQGIGHRFMQAINHKAINRLESATAAAHDALSSTMFQEAPQSPRDLDPVDLHGVARELERLLNTVDTDPAWPRPWFDRMVSHAKHWLALARRTVDSAREAVARLADAETAMAAVMSKVELLPLEPTTPVERLPELAPAPIQAAASSYTDFEVRTSMQDPTPPRSSIEVTVVGDGDGMRTSDRRAR